jgi:PadR family transcriptional regulator, regulatory protein AphA
VTPHLTASSAVVLGLLATGGPQTTYEMMGYIKISIGYFWPFPMSQMYAESKRLEAAGLIVGDQEAAGRRRRKYSITGSGATALSTWLRTPVDRATEIRDIGLLKLFFVDADPSVSSKELAAEQIADHESRLAEYRAIATTFDGSRPMAERTIELGIAFEQVAIDFWQGVHRDGS